MLNRPLWLSRLDRSLALAAVPVLLVALNLLFVWPMFTGELSQFVGSIEVGYIQAGQFLQEFSPHTWNPLWYNGFPFHVMYNPIPPYLEWFVSAVTGSSAGASYRLLTGLAYVLTPAAVYFFGRQLLRSSFGGLLAALFWSLPPSFVSLFPTFRSDALAHGSAPWHLLVLIEYGEGTHTLGLFFLALFGWWLLRAFDRPTFRRIVLAAAGFALVGLTSMIAFFAGLLLFAAVAVSQRIREPGTDRRPWRTAAAVLGIGLGFLAFWFNPDFLKTSFGFGTGGDILKTYSRFALYLPVGLALLFAAAYALFRGRPGRQPLLVILLWFLPLAAVVVAWEKFRLQFAPQPIRYLPEASLAFDLLASLAVVWAVRRLVAFRTVGKFLAAGLVLLTLGGLDLASQTYIRNSQDLVRPRLTPTAESREYRLAKAVEALPGVERVYATGNDAFYLNLFTRVPQLRGALDQAATNRWWNHASYQLLTGDDSVVAADLVRAMNLNYVIVTTAASKNVYHDYRFPEKFASWEKVYEAEGDIVYRSGLAVPGLAQLADGSVYPTLRKPKTAIDQPAIRAYADWVDRNSRPVDAFEWLDNGRARIRVDPSAGEIVSVQVTYDRGWRASDGRKQLKIRRDVLDNLVIEPAAAGPQEIVLEYRKPWFVWLGYAITLATVVALFLYPKFLAPLVQRQRERVAATDRELAERHREELRQLGIDAGPPKNGKRKKRA